MAQWWMVIAPAGLTNEYHSGGGAVVWAESEQQARERIAAHATSERALEIYSVEPLDPADVVYVFPDAGCC